MTKHSLFDIVFKILGIYLFKGVLESIPGLLSLIPFFFKAGSLTEAVYSFLGMVIYLSVEGFFCYLFLFKTEWVFSKLKLDAVFDKEIVPFNLHSSSVLAIAILVLGGFLVVNEIPSFCKEVFNYWEQKRLYYGPSPVEKSPIVVSVVKILIGSLLIYNQRTLVNFIERKRRKISL